MFYFVITVAVVGGGFFFSSFCGISRLYTRVGYIGDNLRACYPNSQKISERKSVFPINDVI